MTKIEYTYIISSFFSDEGGLEQLISLSPAEDYPNTQNDNLPKIQSRLDDDDIHHTVS